MENRKRGEEGQQDRRSASGGMGNRDEENQ